MFKPFFSLAVLLMTAWFVPCQNLIAQNTSDIIERTLDFWSFSKQENWTVHWPKESGEALHRLESGTDFTDLIVQPSDKEAMLPFYSPKLKQSPRFDGLQQLTLDIHVILFDVH